MERLWLLMFLRHQAVELFLGAAGRDVVWPRTVYKVSPCVMVIQNTCICRDDVGSDTPNSLNCLGYFGE